MQTPDELYGDLFKDVQFKKIFPDNKTFVDCTPKRKPEQIVDDYKKLKNPSNEGIKKFVEDNFIMPPGETPGYHTDVKDNVIEHIEELWHVLKRSADKPVEGSSLIAMPYPYIVPGGRFREVFYWDSYFTMLGLAESNEWEIIENMIENFAYLIHEFGFIPNGNRTYFLSRSQPPYFSCMIELLASHNGDSVYAKYQSALQKEHDYWMDKTCSTKHIVQLDDGTVLNRYYDQLDKPRAEAYRQDCTLSEECKINAALLYRDLRAACESGWDFSGRWFTDGKTFNTIQTTNLIPVDLNCLLYHLETCLSKAYTQSNSELAEEYQIKSAQRKAAINKYFYNEKDGWYYDYNISEKKLNNQKTIAGITPFFFNIPPQNYIDKAAALLKDEFLKDGGVVTTLINTEQQWDWPNGWAPLQWIAIKGLENYEQKE
jgi:alpha,alpha-trehalase